MATTSNTPPDGKQYSGYFYVGAWILVFGLFMLVARTKIGYTLLFFFCIASIIIVLAVGSPTIVSIFANAPLIKAPGSTNITVKPQ